MIFKKIEKRFKDIPVYIEKLRFFFGLRLLLRKFITLPVVIKTKRGSWLFLGTDKVDDIILKSLYQLHQDVYFPKNCKLKESDVILDIGGHHGIYAMEISTQFPKVKVFSFEPDKASFRYLKLNCLLNSRRNVYPINAALEAETGNAFIVKSDEGSWGNYVSNESQKGGEKINMIAVKDFLKKYEISSISLVKLNAEGAEFSVLPNLFESGVLPKKIILFAHPERGDVRKLVSLVKSNSYDLESSFEDEFRPWYIFRYID